jgi:polyphosphate kinase 2 (PPK2 family)
VALGTPSNREKTQWYFQRYIPHLPAAGEIVLFRRAVLKFPVDRSTERPARGV